MERTVSSMILLIGKVSIQPDKVDQFLGEINHAIEATLKEEGVSRYELVRSMGEPNTFLLLEEYADESVLISHLATEHLQSLVATLGEVLAGPPEGKRYNVSSTAMLFE